MLLTLLSLFVAFVKEEQKPAQLVGRLIGQADEYTFTVTAPGAENVVRCQQKTNGDDTSWGGWRIVPSVIPTTTTASGNGQVKVSFQFPGRKEPIVLRSKGLAEDVYLLRHLGGEEKAAKWLDQVVPTSKIVVAWPKDKSYTKDEGLDKLSAELVAAVKLGQDAYDANRPELVRRFNKSFLYYAPATTTRWRVSTGKDTLTIETGSVDRMYHSRIRVELRKSENGDWEVSRIVAGEFFKGD